MMKARARANATRPKTRAMRDFNSTPPRPPISRRSRRVPHVIPAGIQRGTRAVWLSADVATVTIAHGQEPLAQDTATVEPDRQHLKDIAPLRLYENHFPPQQLMLWEPDAVEWRLALRRPTPVRGQRRSWDDGIQLHLLPKIAG
jgi:hypothetical protein